MTYDNLKTHIYNYLKNDKTKSAIMLTGNWGTGKSYFINNTLIPYISDEGYDCILLSLYGINSLHELSRNIYWAARINQIKKKSVKYMFLANIKANPRETIKNGTAIIKLLAKGTTSHFGINIDESDKDLLTLYKMFGNIESQIIILEDVERTDIDILQLLGFVNSLVEQDNAKVLLVANEAEIIDKHFAHSRINYKVLNDSNEDENASSNSKSLPDVYNYLATKEKTISDTIQFVCEYKQSIKGIISFFKNDRLINLCGKQEIEDILDIMHVLNNFNLRSFMFACQKTIDIYENIRFDDSDAFCKCIFYSIIAFSLRLKSGIDIDWKYAEDYSYDLGIDKYPLFKFCYEYIRNHELNTVDIEKSYQDYKHLCLYDKRKTKNDKDVRIINDFYCEYEKDVRAAVDSITDRLKNINEISFYDYGRIGTYLILIKHKLNIDVSQALDLMISNIHGRGNNIKADDLFHYSLRYEEDSIRKEYYDFEKSIRKALKNDALFDGFSYKPGQSEKLLEYVRNNEVEFHAKEKFAALLDVQKLIDMFSKSSPREMSNIRDSFNYMYRVDNIKAFLAGDLNYLEDIRVGIIEYLNSDSGDRNQKYQAEYFIQDLTEYIDKIK